MVPPVLVVGPDCYWKSNEALVETDAKEVASDVT